ncbi:hypothetical protein JHK87_000566 [Glycine soja]|nr:hypothetical protein JHK87_000566 [Glycine soja]
MIIDGEVLRQGISAPSLKCLENNEAEYVMNEIQKGICSMFSEGRSMASKVFQAGYYWPTMHANCAKYSKRCKEC